MATVVQDSFTDTSAKLLESHVGEIGATWTKHSASGTSSAVISNANRARSNTVSGTSLYYASGTPATAEYDVQSDFVCLSTALTTTYTGVVGRLDTAANTLYLGRYNAGNWQLYKFIAGTATLLGSFAQTLTLNQTYVVKLGIRTAAKTLTIDGVTQITSADDAVPGIGKGGVRIVDDLATDTGRIHLDNFLVTDLSAANPILMIV